MKKSQSLKIDQAVLEKTLDTIKEKQIGTVMRLRSSAEGLRTEVERLIKKIDDVGASGYYSVNADSFSWAQKVWKDSWRLGELKRIEDKVNEELKKSKKAPARKKK